MDDFPLLDGYCGQCRSLFARSRSEVDHDRLAKYLELLSAQPQGAYEFANAIGAFNVSPGALNYATPKPPEPAEPEKPQWGDKELALQDVANDTEDRFGNLHPLDLAAAFRALSEWALERATEQERHNEHNGVPDR